MKWIKAEKEKPKITREWAGCGIEDGYRSSEDVLCYNKCRGMFVARWSEFEGNRKNFWNPDSTVRDRYRRVEFWSYIPIGIPKDDE